MNASPQLLNPLPRCDSDQGDGEPPLATSQWYRTSDVLAAIKKGARDRPRNPIILGQLWEGARNHLFVADDDRHVVTIAGSRAGKGRGLILPNLLSYPGSVVCIDPKGENAAVTAQYRKAVLGQNVVILDPFRVLRERDDLAPLCGSFNPFEWINAEDPEAIDEVSALADALIVRDNQQDPHWNESARAFLKGVMLQVMEIPKYQCDDRTGDVIATNWTLGLVRRRASLGFAISDDASSAEGQPSLEGLLALMKSNSTFDGAVAAAAHLLEQMGDRERGGVLANLRRHTEFLESPAIATSLADSDFNPFAVAREPTTIYLVLPEWRMGTHARWLRVLITSLMQALQRTKRQSDRPATLFILDEFATLGHMESIERAAGYIAGFGVKLWIILQDLNQLKSLYAGRWETFLGNAGTLTAFGNADVTTLEYLSKRLGETELVRTLVHMSHQQGSGETSAGLGQALDALAKGRLSGAILGADSVNVQSGVSYTSTPALHKTALITADEIGRVFSRETETVLVHFNGKLPLRLNRIRYDIDEPFRSRAAPSPYH